MKDCCDHSSKIDVKDILKQAGFSATKVKVKMVEIFAESKTPLACHELAQIITDADESTLFRNIKQLLQAGIINEINLSEGFKRYEYSPEGHHHHYIKCTSCERIDVLNLCDLKIFQKQLKALGYSNISHKIEFSGTCTQCS
jgi:Fur family ferric uptake transcriptional regulator